MVQLVANSLEVFLRLQRRLLNPKPETTVRRRSQTQTHVGLTSCPRTRSSRAKRYSTMMMLKTGSLFLILYGLCQISLAQAQTPRKDETTGTTQTWKGQELGGGRPRKPQSCKPLVAFQLLSQLDAEGSRRASLRVSKSDTIISDNNTAYSQPT
ncbi:unnamed protein product [Gadus morhua 'NCC']